MQSMKYEKKKHEWTKKQTWMNWKTNKHELKNDDYQTLTPLVGVIQWDNVLSDFFFSFPKLNKHEWTEKTTNMK